MRRAAPSANRLPLGGKARSAKGAHHERRVGTGVRDGAASVLVGAGMGAVAGRLSGAGARTVASARTASRYMGSGEAATVAETRTIPTTDAAGRPRVIHFTTDAPVSSAAEAQARYNLSGAPPTHVCQFPLCNVQNSVPPTGTVAHGATQAATSLPINGAGRPIPLDP